MKVGHVGLLDDPGDGLAAPAPSLHAMLGSHDTSVVIPSPTTFTRPYSSSRRSAPPERTSSRKRFISSAKTSGCAPTARAHTRPMIYRQLKLHLALGLNQKEGAVSLAIAA